MAYDIKHHAERRRRVSKKITQMGRCLNNTKWRELFRTAARHKLAFTIAWVGDSAWSKEALQLCVPERLIEEDGIRDPGIGGPCFFRDILWIRFPFVRRSAKWGDIRQDVVSFASELKTLGKIPIRETESYVEIRGYESKEPNKIITAQSASRVAD